MSTSVFVAVLIVLIALGAAFMAKAGDKHRAIDRKLKSLSDFHPTVSSIQTSLTSALAIDAERKKLAILRASATPEHEWRHSVYSFDDVVAVELVKDGSSIIKTQRGSQLAAAAIGGALLGPAGLIVGGLSGSKTQQNMIEKLALKIYVNDLVFPVQEIVFLHWPNGGIPPHLAELAVAETEQWYSRLRVIVEKQ